MCMWAGKVRKVGERAGLELKASESTVPDAPTRKARHDHLTRKLRRKAHRKGRCEIRPATRPHRTAHAKHQHAAARTHRPLRGPSYPSSTCPPTCLSAAAGSPATTAPSPYTTPPAAKSSRTSPTPASNRASKHSTPPATPAPRGRQPASANARHPQPRLHAHDATNRSHRPAHDPRNG